MSMINFLGKLSMLSYQRVSVPKVFMYTTIDHAKVVADKLGLAPSRYPAAP